MDQKEFFSEATEAQRYKLTEVIGKGSYGVVASAVDQFTGTPPRQLCARTGGQAAPLLLGTLGRRRPPPLSSRACRGEGGHQEDHKRV